MANFNPMQFIQMMKNGQNPQQLMLSFLENQMSNTPIGANLIQLAKNNNTSEIERFARNIVKQSGKDFDTEFNAFKQMFGL